MSHEAPRTAESVSTAFDAPREYWHTTGAFEPRRPTDSVRARYAHGKELRKTTPRESHAEFRPAPDRADPVATSGARRT
jgi:hypothetical protein